MEGGRGLEHLVEDAADDLAHAHAQGVVALGGPDGGEAADEDAEVLDDFGARQGGGVEVRVLGLLEEFDGQDAGGGDAEVADGPGEADLVVGEAVAVGGEGDDAVEHFFGGVEQVELVLRGAVVGQALEEEAVEEELEAEVHAQDLHVVGDFGEGGFFGLQAQVGRETGVGLLRALLHVAIGVSLL